MWEPSSSKKLQSREKLTNLCFTIQNFLKTAWRDWLVFAAHKDGDDLRLIKQLAYGPHFLSNNLCRTYPKEHKRQSCLSITSPCCQPTIERHRKHPSCRPEPSPRHHCTTKMQRSQMNSGPREPNYMWESAWPVSFWSTHKPKSHHPVFCCRGTSNNSSG